MNIVVLCGGTSGERDVSITSGTAVTMALRENGHNAVLLDVFMGYCGKYDSASDIFNIEGREKAEYCKVSEELPDIDSLRASRKGNIKGFMGNRVIELCSAADFVFLALHGDEGENGQVQAYLDLEGIKYTGSGYLGSAIAMNKYLTKQILRQSGICTPDGILLTRGEGIKSIGYPCVVKPCSGGSSVATTIVRSADGYEKAVNEAFIHDRLVLVEKYIHGRELTVGVMDGEAMPVIEIVPKQGFYDYKNKYQAGLTEDLCPAPLDERQTKEIQDIAVRVYQALQLDVYCRVDLLLGDDGKFYCLEANTLPGMTATSLIPQMARNMGISFPQLCDNILSLSLKKYIR